MHGHLVLSVFLGLAIMASTYAAGSDDPAPAPNFPPNGSVLLNDQVPPSLDPALDAQPASAGPYHNGDRGYYAQHSAIDEGTVDKGNCCAEYFGGFGCLWETYCADRHRGCGAVGGRVSGCRPMPVYPSLRCAIGRPLALDRSGWQTRRTRIHRPGCRVTPCDCGCDTASAAVIGPSETAPQEVGVPLEPIPAEPYEATEPAPPPTLDTPDVPEVKNASSRRNWPHRQASSMSR
jgi:hypothetical protein